MPLIKTEVKKLLNLRLSLTRTNYKIFEKYLEFVNEAYNENISKPELVKRCILYVLKNDNEFKKYLKEKDENLYKGFSKLK